jgi:hypothetical protein
MWHGPGQSPAGTRGYIILNCDDMSEQSVTRRQQKCDTVWGTCILHYSLLRLAKRSNVVMASEWNWMGIVGMWHDCRYDSP